MKKQRTLSSQFLKKKKKNTFGEFVLPGLRLENKTTIQVKSAVKTTVWYWRNDRYIDL